MWEFGISFFCKKRFFSGGFEFFLLYLCEKIEVIRAGKVIFFGVICS